MDKVLVTGIDGVAGSNIALALSDRYEMFGICDADPVELAGCTLVGSLADSTEDALRWIELHEPKWIVHCGPLSRSSWDLAAGEFPLDWQADLQFATRLAELSKDIGSSLAVLATDAVFAGPRMFHEENYEQTGTGAAADAARQLEAALGGSDVLLCRTNPYGWSPTQSRVDFAERIWQCLSEDVPCEVEAERHGTPVLASDLAELLVLAFRTGLRGVYHLTGAERTSPFRFAAEMALTGGFCGRNVHLAESDPDPSRCFVFETSLNTRRARRALRHPLPMLREGLGRFVEQAANGFRERIEGQRHAALMAA